MNTENIGITTQYNDLPTVFDADAGLNARDRQMVFVTLGLIIRNHGLEELLGFRLLHRHNVLYGDEIMVEKSAFDELGRFILVSQPTTNIANEDRTIAANSWRVLGGKYFPLEFSDRTLLADSEVTPATRPACFGQLAEALLDLKVEELVGPVLLNGSAVESQRQVEDAVLLEESDEESRRNTCRFVGWNEVKDKSVETLWKVSDFIECSTPPKPKPTPGRTCRRVCPQVRPGVHKGTFTHLPN